MISFLSKYTIYILVIFVAICMFVKHDLSLPDPVYDWTFLNCIPNLTHLIIMTLDFAIILLAIFIAIWFTEYRHNEKTK